MTRRERARLAMWDVVENMVKDWSELNRPDNLTGCLIPMTILEILLEESCDYNSDAGV